MNLFFRWVYPAFAAGWAVFLIVDGTPIASWLFAMVVLINAGLEWAVVDKRGKKEA